MDFHLYGSGVSHVAALLGLTKSLGAVCDVTNVAGCTPLMTAICQDDDVMADVSKHDASTLLLAWFPTSHIDFRLGTKHCVIVTCVGVPPVMCYSTA